MIYLRHHQSTFVLCCHNTSNCKP